MVGPLSAFEPVTLPAEVKAGTRVMLLAKHARGDGRPDPVDGNHAIYHRELRDTLEAIGFPLVLADSYEALFARPAADFVIPLLNRGGFQNSEMLAPLLLARLGMPYLGAPPIIRGLSDDKHLMKLVARRHGVSTADWAVYRVADGAIPEPDFRPNRFVVKPNASSASWGVSIVESWAEARRCVEQLHAERQDVIVEAWTPRLDVAVPVVGGRGPWFLPPMAYRPPDLGAFRSYAEKRALVATGDDPLEPVLDAALNHRLNQATGALMRELWPFDYGRFEFRYDPATDDLSFMEVNLSCNLWSRKTISRSAALVGLGHRALVETIVAHSLVRQGLVRPDLLREAA